MTDIIQIVVTEEPIQVIPTNFIPVGGAVSSSYATTASFADNATSASFATTASYASNVPLTSSYAVSASHALNSDNAISASNVLYNNIGQKPTLFSGSSQVQLNEITGTTFANANFVFPADVSILGTATVKQLYTQYETSSIIFASGSTKFGDTADDTHQMTGSVSITGSFKTNTLTYPAVDGLANQVITTDGAGNLTFDDAHTILEEIHTGEAITKGDPLYVSGSQGATPVVYKADAGDAAKMPVVFIALETVGAGANTRGIVLGLIEGLNLTGYNAGDEVYVGVGGGWTATRPTGSAIVQLLGIITKGGSGGKGLVLNPGPVELPNLNSGSVWVGDGNGVPVAVTTSSLVDGKTIAPAAINATGIISASSLITSNSSSIAGIVINNPGLSTTSPNIAIGPNALGRLPAGATNTGSIVIGFNAGANISGSGHANAVIIGTNAYASASNTAQSVIAIGLNSVISSSANNLAIGASTLMTASQNFNVAIGNNALNRLRIGTDNTAIGNAALQSLVSGASNNAIGRLSLSSLQSGSRNMAVGLSIGSLRSGSDNTAVGNLSLATLPSGSNNIGLGGNSGRYITSGSNELFINSIDRTNATGDYSSSIIYGRQSEVASGQTLRLNAQVLGVYGFTGSLQGNADTATSASFATTASYAANVPDTASFAVSSSFATTASAATSITFTPTSASYALTASFATNVASAFPFSGSAIITGSLTISGSGAPSQSTLTSSIPDTTPVDLNGIYWSGSYGSSSIIPSIASASDLGSQKNPFRNAYFAGFVSASQFVGFTGSVQPPLVVSASFTYDASSATPVTGTTGSVAGIHDQIKACILSSSGTRLYYLNPTNWAQKEDTTASTLNGTNQHVMIEIPKFYWTASQAGTGATRSVTYKISTDAASTGSGFNFQLHPAFYKSGSVVDYRYVSAYLACGRSGSVIYAGSSALDTGSAANQLASISGSAPLHTRSKISFRRLANNIGNGWGLHEIYLQNALELLYLTEYKTLDTQTQLGNGNGSTSAVAGGSNAYANGSTPNGYVGSIRYRGIENLYGAISQWMDGIVISPAPITTYVTNNQEYFGDYFTSSSLANYVKVSGSIATIANGAFWGDYYEYNSHQLPLIIPNATGGSATTKFCDFGYAPDVAGSPTFAPSASYSMGNNSSTAGNGGWWYREVEVPSRGDSFYGTRITY